MTRLILAYLLLCPVLWATDAEVRVKVLAAYQAALRQPDLPDSLENRPRVNQSGGGDFGARFPVPLVDPAPIDEQLSSDPDIAGLEWWLDNGCGTFQYLVFTQENCRPCQSFHANTLTPLFRADCRIAIVSLNRNPFFAEYFDVSSTPTTIAIYRGRELPNTRIVGNAPKERIARMFDSVRDPADVTRAEKTNVAHESTSCMWLRGRWTWPGPQTVSGLRQHLTQPPHNLARSVVEAMTPNQLVSEHNRFHDLHGGSGQRGNRGRRTTFIHGRPVELVC